MQVINIIPVPSQEITITINNIRWLLRLKGIGNSVIMDVNVNGEEIVKGLKLLGNTQIIPYNYLSIARGNFMMEVEEGELVDWEKFGDTQNLFYFNEEEVKKILGERSAEWGF